MATATPIHDWEKAVPDATLTGVSWTVPPHAHDGHTMTCEARIVSPEWGGPSSMMLVRCSCGESFRMADETVRRHL